MDSVALSGQPGVWIAPILLSLPGSQSASQVQAHVFLPPLEGFNPDRISILELQRSTTYVGCPENKAGGISKAQLKTYKVGFCRKLPYRLLQLWWIGYALNSPGSQIRSEICLSRANPLYPAFVMSPLLIY